MSVCNINRLVYIILIQQTVIKETSVHKYNRGCSRELEYLPVYGRASYASFPSALNTYRASSQQCARGATKYTWSKVWPWILIWAYLIWNFEPIFGQQISILDPPPLRWTFCSVLVWTFTLQVNLGVGVDWASDIFCHGRTETLLLKSRLSRIAARRRD